MEDIIYSIKDLNNLTKKLLDKGYTKFLLNGDLGVGKTEFVRQLAKNLDIYKISSPTYTYINIYNEKLIHGDFYRIKNKNEFINLGIIDMLEDYEYICIEWPKFEYLYADNKWLKINITKLDKSIRKIKYTNYQPTL